MPGPAVFVHPDRAMPVAWEEDGTLRPLGPWVELRPPMDDDTQMTTHSSLDLFDAFENDGSPCGTTARPSWARSCGLDGDEYRWWFGPNFCNMFAVSEMDAESATPAMRVEFAWYWRGPGYGFEDCYVAILTGDTFDSTCAVQYRL